MILNIIDKIYENSNFTKYLIIAFIILILLLIIVYIIGRIEYKRKNTPKKVIEEDVKDITFDLPTEQANIKDDVTFEMPVLTKNLEEFKKSLEEEIEKEEEISVRKTSGVKLKEETKSIKILDKDVIDDTAIVSLKNIELANQENSQNNSVNIQPENFLNNKKNFIKKEEIAINDLPKENPNHKEQESFPFKPSVDETDHSHKKVINSLDSIYDASDDF